MWELADTPDIMIAFGTLLMASAAVAGAVIAGIGLNMWKQQNIWQTDGDLAKRALYQRP